jgi:hypothetical protein
MSTKQQEFEQNASRRIGTAAWQILAKECEEFELDVSFC